MQAPDPLQESVPSQAPPFEVPTQEVVEDWKPSVGHTPDNPVHVSATSHWPADARQENPDARRTSTQELLVPVQWSAASLSHAPPCEAPVQTPA